MKYLLIFSFCLIVFTANAAPPVKDVNVVNTPGVTIENGPLDPVPVIQSRPERTPYSHDHQAVFITGSSYSHTFSPATADRLAIETVTYYVDLSSPQQLRYATMSTSANGVNSSHRLTVPEGRTISGRTIYSISIPIRLYVDPGTYVTILLNGTDLSGGTASMSVSGYLIPADATSLAP